jgi:hypothetical protein
MKKILILAFLFLFSCSNDDNETTNCNCVTLTQTKQTKVINNVPTFGAWNTTKTTPYNANCNDNGKITNQRETTQSNGTNTLIIYTRDIVECK